MLAQRRSVQGFGGRGSSRFAPSGSGSHRATCLAIAILSLVALLDSQPSQAFEGDVFLVSTSDTGQKYEGGSSWSAMSGDGNLVAFAGTPHGLFESEWGSPGSNFQIYVKNLATGELSLVSSSDSGQPSNAFSVSPAISRDGRRVAFRSLATNLDPADSDFYPDVYVKDLLSGELVLASTSDTGEKANEQWPAGPGYDVAGGLPSLSGDGSKVAFWSPSTNLDPGDSDTALDVYVKDLVTGDIILASTSDTGEKAEGPGGSFYPTLSEDGGKVAFSSCVTNLDPAVRVPRCHVYMKDLATGDIVLVSTSDTGLEANDDSYSWQTSISADGTRVAFSSTATNLDGADTDQHFDIYVKDLLTGEVTLASSSDSGQKGVTTSFGSWAPSLAADGNVVAFVTNMIGLDPGDSDEQRDVYVKNLTTGDITLASASASEKANGDSDLASLSANGTRVTFASRATNLYPTDLDDHFDVYAKDLEPNPVPAESRANPVVLVHGVDFLGKPSIDYDKRTNWTNAIARWTEWGWTGPFVKVGYYEHDQNWDARIDGYGAPQPDPHRRHCPNGSTSDGCRGEHTVKKLGKGNELWSHGFHTDIEHIAYHLAWYLYQEFARHGVHVDAVGHSMGGLILRYAIAQAEAGHRDFPPELFVDDVVTLGSPHAGASRASLCGRQIIRVEQCLQMEGSSSFIRWLSENAVDPDGSGGTDWTLIGSEDDQVVTPHWSQTAMAASHRVVYADGEDIEHSGGDWYLDWTDLLFDKKAFVAEGEDATAILQTGVARPVKRVDLALASSAA